MSVRSEVKKLFAEFYEHCDKELEALRAGDTEQYKYHATAESVILQEIKRLAAFEERK